MSPNGDVLARFHRALVEEIRAKRPEYLDGLFTVAEIYQNLVPYGTHRDRLGIEMNGDYEDALLRMLSGEGGYLILESDAALRALREEVEASNPNTGLYREYAAVDVRLDPSRLLFSIQGGAAPGIPELESMREEMLSVASLAPESEEDQASPAAASDVEPESSPAGAASDPEHANNCRWCRAELPQRGHLKFCPFCGTDVSVVPCPSCGEELEPDWRFCIACGAEVVG